MENSSITQNGFRLDAEFKDVPVSFVNALRRMSLTDIPTVVVSNVQILENTTQMTHEMIRHRVEMTPINVRAHETNVIRDTKIELRFMPDPKRRIITSDDFVVAGPRNDVILRDRDLNEPLLFMYINPNERLHIRCTLAIEARGNSQVCVSTFKNHIDPVRAQLDKDTFVAEGGNPKVFDSFYIQRSYSRNAAGRPNWFDFAVESIGVTPAADLVREAVEILKTHIVEWAKLPLLREDANWYRIESETESHTLGNIMQELMYHGELVEYVSRDVGHPLVPKLTIRFQTKLPPESVIDKCKTEALALCESVLKSV